MPDISPDISEALEKRLSSDGPKRILSLDGGGIRGAVTLGFLGEIERILAERHEKNDIMIEAGFRLHHYFDLIGGTSTGCIIAALLAVGGYSATEIKNKYRQLAASGFSYSQAAD